MIAHTHRDPALIGGLSSAVGVYLRTGTPSTITGLKLWLAAWDEAYANNDPVGTMRDGSGNGADCTQSGSKRPTFKTNVINSKAAFYFDGSDDYVDVPDIFSGMSAGQVFIILRGDSSQGSGGDVGLWAMPGTNDNENYPWSDGNIYDGWFSTTRKSCGTPGAGFVGMWHVYEVVSTGSEYTAFHNGTQFFTTASNTPGGARNDKTLGRSSLGSGYLFQGWVAEIFVYDNKISGGDRSAIYSYINGKYGL